MKKLTLNLDELRVDSFESTVAEAGVGTVRGLEYVEYGSLSYCRPCFYTQQETCPTD